MKKRRLLVGALILGVAALTACDNNSASTPTPTPNQGSDESKTEPTHQHTYATEWSKNETKHWHESTCGHDLKKDEAEHTFDNGVVDGNNMKYSCTACGYSYTVECYEVTEQGWKDAFDNSKMTNYTAVLSTGNGGTYTYKYYTGDDKIIACLLYADLSYPDTYYIKTSSTITGYQKGENGNWVKIEESLSDIDDTYKVGIDWFLSYKIICPNFGEFYDKFTYSNNSLSYNFVGEEGSNEIETNSIMEMWHARYYNVEVKFEVGNLKQIKAYMSGQGDNALNTITFSDYGTTTIEIPNID